MKRYLILAASILLFIVFFVGYFDYSQFALENHFTDARKTFGVENAVLVAAVAPGSLGKTSTMPGATPTPASTAPVDPATAPASPATPDTSNPTPAPASPTDGTAPAAPAPATPDASTTPPTPTPATPDTSTTPPTPAPATPDASTTPPAPAPSSAPATPDPSTVPPAPDTNAAPMTAPSTMMVPHMSWLPLLQVAATSGPSVPAPAAPSTSGTPTPESASAPATNAGASTAPSTNANTSPAEPPRAAPVEASVIVLLYHQFVPAGVKIPAKLQWTMNQDVFESEMKYLHDNGYHVVSMADLLRFLRHEIGLPPNSVVITIDDGYKSAITYAAPILKQYNYPWTFFIYPEFVTTGEGKSAVSWSDLLALQAQGIDIECHSMTHPILPSHRQKIKGVVQTLSDAEYDQWLNNEISADIARDELR